MIGRKAGKQVVSPREMLLHGARDHVAKRMRREDALIEREEVKEEDDGDDEQEVLVLYSEHSSERSSPCVGEL